MTTQELNYYKAAASLGLLEDEINPLFIFNSTNKDLLLEIVSGSLDILQLARMQLRDRGLDLKTGQFVGWSSKTTSDVLV